MYIEQVINKELLLTKFIEAQGMNNLPRENPIVDFGNPTQILHTIHRTADALEKHLGSGVAITSPITFILLSTIYAQISKLIGVLSHPPPDVDTFDLASHALKSLRHFLTQMNQAGFSLAMDYAACVLASRSLPYEAFNTFRRIFLKINFDLRVSVQSQSRFVTYLDDALESDSEGGIHIPESIINIILGLTRAVDDPTCALKAKTIISRCMRFFPSEDEAQKALSVLDEALPQPTPILDLFTSHMYSNLKLDKGPTQPHVRGPVIIPNIAEASMRRKHETA
jgi:hypothetical protein